MERDEKNHQQHKPPFTTSTTTTTKAPSSSSSEPPEFVFQWGKRLRCVRVKTPNFSPTNGIRQKITTRIVTTDNTTTTAGNDPSFSLLNRFTRVSSEERKSGSPEKEERYYTTRGVAVGEERERVNIIDGVNEREKGNFVWPKLYVGLSSKEKEEDFLAMKGCKLPQRPKKRAKLIQRTLLFVSPGAWLTDMCQERYEVREKKTPKKRPRGLKAMGGALDSDSE